MYELNANNGMCAMKRRGWGARREGRSHFLSVYDGPKLVDVRGGFDMTVLSELVMVAALVQWLSGRLCGLTGVPS